MKSKARAAYHHGDLPTVLLQKTEELLAERGADGFSLREVARRADVAAAAPSHHFGNATGLLTAVATKSFREMTARFQAAGAKAAAPKEHLVALCQAYVDHHAANVGGAAIMFRWELLATDNPDFAEACSASFNELSASVRKNVKPTKTDEEIEAIAKVIWAAMHGLVGLKLVDQNDPSKLVRLAALSAIMGHD